MQSNINKLPTIPPINVSVVVPCFNEQDVLDEFHRRITEVRELTQHRCEVIYIDDGSSDQTFHLIEQLCASEDVVGVRLSRNFGKEAAMSAGLAHARGDAVIFIDADLQDPPELIPKMISIWERGYDIVNMKRSSRVGDGFVKRKTAGAFYWLVGRLNSKLHYPSEVSDFRLIGKEALSALRQLSENSRSFKSLISWVGYNCVEVEYEREPRFAGETKWNFLGLADLAAESIMAVSRKPLRWLSYSMLLFFVLSLLAIVVSVLTSGVSVSLLLVFAMSFLGLAVTVVGEYVGVIVDEVKARPHYFVSTVVENGCRSLGGSVSPIGTSITGAQ